MGIVARYPVTVFTADGFLDGVTQQINSRGAFIRCRRPPRQHETATIRIQLSKRESLLVEAEVMMLHFSEPNENQEVAGPHVVDGVPHANRSETELVVGADIAEIVGVVGEQHLER